MARNRRRQTGLVLLRAGAAAALCIAALAASGCKAASRRAEPRQAEPAQRRRAPEEKPGLLTKSRPRTDQPFARVSV